MSASTLERLTEILTDHFGVTATEVRPDATLAELDLDSLAIVEFAMLTEREFGIALSETEVTPNATVTETLELLGSKGVPADG